MTITRLRAVERRLPVLVVLTAVVGLLIPDVGRVLSAAITPLLALLIFCVALTFDLPALRENLRRPLVPVLATVLVYGPMGVAGYALAELLVGQGPLGLGIVLVGVLPTDVSSPLLVWMARGNVPLATVANAVNTALAPLLVPVLFLLWTGVQIEVPVGGLIVELALTVLAPTIAGVALRTRFPRRIEPLEPLLSAGSALAYLALLLAVVGPNADAIIGEPARLLPVVAAALALNGTGYLLALAARPLVTGRGDRIALLFTVSKKEFSIAAFVVAASGLPAEVALPAVIYAVVQMLTSPAVASLSGRRTG